MKKLNVGCGLNYFDGYVNVDINTNVKADFYFNLEMDTFPFENDTFDSILCNHVLEHLGDGYFHCMKEIYRVAKHNADFLIIVPNFTHKHYYDDPTHKRTITVNGISLFDKLLNIDNIIHGFSNSTLGLDLDIDFKVINSYQLLDPIYFNKKNDHIDDIIDKYWNVVESTYIHAKVIKDFKMVDVKSLQSQNPKKISDNNLKWIEDWAAKNSKAYDEHLANLKDQH